LHHFGAMKKFFKGLLRAETKAAGERPNSPILPERRNLSTPHLKFFKKLEEWS
jgi:hypothetical protein